MTSGMIHFTIHILEIVLYLSVSALDLDGTMDSTDGIDSTDGTDGTEDSTLGTRGIDGITAGMSVGTMAGMEDSHMETRITAGEVGVMDTIHTVLQGSTMDLEVMESGTMYL